MATMMREVRHFPHHCFCVDAIVRGYRRRILGRLNVLIAAARNYSKGFHGLCGGIYDLEMADDGESRPIIVSPDKVSYGMSEYFLFGIYRRV